MSSLRSVWIIPYCHRNPRESYLICFGKWASTTLDPFQCKLIWDNIRLHTGGRAHIKTIFGMVGKNGCFVQGWIRSSNVRVKGWGSPKAGHSKISHLWPFTKSTWKIRQTLLKKNFDYLFGAIRLDALHQGIHSCVGSHNLRHARLSKPTPQYPHHKYRKQKQFESLMNGIEIQESPTTSLVIERNNYKNHG